MNDNPDLKQANPNEVELARERNRAAGFNADLEKYLEAGLAGWRVFRFGPDQITMENVVRLIAGVSRP